MLTRHQRVRWASVLALLAAPAHSLQSSSALSLPAVHVPCHSRPTASARAHPSSGAAAEGGRHEWSHFQRRPSHLCASKSTDEVEAEEDFDALLFEELFEPLPPAKDNGDQPKASHFIEGETAIGIGGSDGYTYDINKLKRNLVQESVRDCKQELLALLGDGRQFQADRRKVGDDSKKKVIVPPRWRRERDDLIEERLSALVQANPVSTTTDSNLLDGEWSFAFATNSASTILDTSRFLLSKTKRPGDTGDGTSAVRGGPWRFRSGKTENPFRSSSREIYLENLSANENAHIIDETRVLGGLFETSRRYDVFGFTRTSIDLDFAESESRLFGFRVGGSTDLQKPVEIQVLYLDTDLCICTTGLGLDGPLHVYTKSDLWVTGGAKRKLRLIAKTASWASTLQSPLRIRQRVGSMLERARARRRLKADPGSGLKAVNIGELDLNDDGTPREDPAWDGPDDPFMHLSPGERMEVLKKMSLQDIYQEQNKKKMQDKKQKKWIGGRGKKFKRPELTATMAKNPIFAVLWLALLVFLAWPIAGICAGPLEGCFSFVRDITSFLEKIVTWPRDCGKAIGDCSTSCPTPL
ncbi:hypothetical protein ACHAXT_010265 [Thalassiosira profunda]